LVEWAARVGLMATIDDVNEKVWYSVGEWLVEELLRRLGPKNIATAMLLAQLFNLQAAYGTAMGIPFERVVLTGVNILAWQGARKGATWGEMLPQLADSWAAPCAVASLTTVVMPEGIANATRELMEYLLDTVPVNRLVYPLNPLSPSDDIYLKLAAPHAAENRKAVVVGIQCKAHGNKTNLDLAKELAKHPFGRTAEELPFRYVQVFLTTRLQDTLASLVTDANLKTTAARVFQPNSDIVDRKKAKIVVPMDRQVVLALPQGLDHLFGPEIAEQVRAACDARDLETKLEALSRQLNMAVRLLPNKS
jgi:hypothetical protein